MYNKKFLQKLAESKTSSEFVSREFFLKRNWIPQKGQHHRSLRGDAALSRFASSTSECHNSWTPCIIVTTYTMTDLNLHPPHGKTFLYVTSRNKIPHMNNTLHYTMLILCNVCQHNAANCFKQSFLLLPLSIGLSINFDYWLKNCGTHCTFQWWRNSNC